jgi:hypothetical protein
MTLGATTSMLGLSAAAPRGKMENLPQPVEGQTFTVANARAYAHQAGELEAA